jgi:protocatechuate 3,4-dioxygenase beta subunit
MFPRGARGWPPALATALLGACAPEPGLAPDGAPPDASADATPCVTTPQQPRGPSYVEGAPMRENLVTGVALALPLTVVGRVLAPDCETPVAGAVLDVWSADSTGVYDGGELDPDGDPAPAPEWPLRGRLRAVETGHFTFYTAYPGPAEGRTRQIHLIVSADGYATLTTQIYFLGVAENDADPAFDVALAVPVHDHGFAGLHAVVPILLAAAP